jgi:hypothetical protein
MFIATMQSQSSDYSFDNEKLREWFVDVLDHHRMQSEVDLIFGLVPCVMGFNFCQWIL